MHMVKLLLWVTTNYKPNEFQSILNKFSKYIHNSYREREKKSPHIRQSILHTYLNFNSAEQRATSTDTTQQYNWINWTMANGENALLFSLYCPRSKILFLEFTHSCVKRFLRPFTYLPIFHPLSTFSAFSSVFCATFITSFGFIRFIPGPKNSLRSLCECSLDITRAPTAQAR